MKYFTSKYPLDIEIILVWT